MKKCSLIRLVLVCAVVLGLLLVFASCNKESRSKQEVEETLYEGMWYAGIVEFMGEEGARVEGDDIIYQWTLSGGEILRIVFEHPWCGMAVLPDEYSLISYYVLDPDKHGESREPGYDNNKHFFGDFDLPDIEEVSYIEVGIHDGRFSMNVEDKAQLAQIYRYIQEAEAYPCGTTQGYYGVEYPITIFAGSREYHYTIIGKNIFTVTGAESIGRYSQLFMTYDLEPLTVYLDVLVAEYQLQCIVGEYRSDSEKRELAGDGVEISPGIFEYWLYDGRKILVTYDTEGEGQDLSQSTIVSFEVVGDAPSIPERVETRVPRLESVDGVLYRLSEDGKSYAVCGVDLIGVKSELKLEDYIHGLPVREISSGAFRFADKVTEIIISDTVKEIKSGALYYCKNLERIYIPASVEKIGKNVFQDCDDLVLECEATTRPDGWDEYWNTDYYGRNPYDVVWGR